MNQIIHGDNLSIMQSISPCSVDLIYADPPFFTQRNFKQFNDKWGDLQSYIGWMVPRLKEMYRLLKPTGSIYLHCDWHAVHYLKVEMDRIFGYDNFRNEIIWSYFGPGSPKMKQFNRKHDTILWYSKGKNWTFNRNDVVMPHAESTKKRFEYKNPFPGKQGLPAGGKTPEDWWPDIAIVARSKTENLGYPTQKPETLLERIIKASSNEGDIVLDPFCGCGTSCAVAQKLNRQYIGIDNNIEAVNLSKNRLIGRELS